MHGSYISSCLRVGSSKRDHHNTRYQYPNFYLVGSILVRYTVRERVGGKLFFCAHLCVCVFLATRHEDGLRHINRTIPLAGIWLTVATRRLR